MSQVMAFTHNGGLDLDQPLLGSWVNVGDLDHEGSSPREGPEVEIRVKRRSLSDCFLDSSNPGVAHHPRREHRAMERRR